MKIRSGFVSNSSSSSFMIYGAILSKELDYEEQEKLEEDTGLEVYSPGDWGETYIGRDWSSLKDDETGKQFKEAVEQVLKKEFPDENLTFGTHAEEWYDG